MKFDIRIVTNKKRIVSSLIDDFTQNLRTMLQYSLGLDGNNGSELLFTNIGLEREWECLFETGIFECSYLKACSKLIQLLK